jgi:hypothetical protein
MTTNEIQTTPRLVKVRGTHDGIRQYLSAQATAGTVQGWDERVVDLPNGEIEVTLHKTPTRAQVHGHRDTRAEERFMYSVAAVGVGLVMLPIVVTVFLLALSPLGWVAAGALAAAMLFGGGATCAGIHCAGCK